MQLYLAGKVSQDPDYKSKFKRYADTLAFNYDVWNPAEMVEPDTDWESAMEICIDALLVSDVAAFMPDWKDSDGACLEHHVAEENNIPIMYL
jgi:hypothetical protein